ncbi:hypothetical protein [Nitrosomonas aestuarii]|uniref:hypothetical protein n=1 Tax=Nitrosomonas aestuarii TaxID=52441 RepID=UPI000D490278|nr:hypothetical protein [Nitrosomonas aestuarii]PTN11945.1 hypothetical protein C8R11_10681 [Nitrosomonas aestuarii]
MADLNCPQVFHPAELLFCSQYYGATRYTNALHMVSFTLTKMARGGIFDQLNGSFFFTSLYHETLIHRLKPALGNTTPSGSGITVITLQRLEFILGENRYISASKKLQLFYLSITTKTSGYASS